MADWRKCNSCKKQIAYNQTYWNCNVSTCNRRRTQLHFCSVGCYDAHLPLMNHRESWALEVKAPSVEAWSKFSAAEGQDAIWPPPPAKEKPTGEEALPSGGFGSSSGAGNKSIRRKKP
jgi:hypothetical protein